MTMMMRIVSSDPPDPPLELVAGGGGPADGANVLGVLVGALVVGPADGANVLGGLVGALVVGQLVGAVGAIVVGVHVAVAGALEATGALVTIPPTGACVTKHESGQAGLHVLDHTIWLS
jgi:hypothetical protein